MKLGESLLAARNKAFLLQSCPICSSLGDDALVPIAKMTREKSLQKDEVLALQGQPCTGFYLVLSGKLRVFRSSPEGKERVLFIVEAGMTFGESALFGDGTFLENAAALEKSAVLEVPREPFLSLLKEKPQLALQVMESLCVWIRRLSTSVENFAFLGAKDKVVRYLMEQAKNTQDVAITLTDKKKAIADRLCMTPETFSRVLHELEQRGLIAIRGKTIEISAADRLKESLE